jgi:hypothetical protein
VYVLTNITVPRVPMFLTREEKMKFKGKPIDISELWYE